MIEKKPAKTVATKPQTGTAKTTKDATRATARPAAPKTTAAAIAGKSAAWATGAGTRQGVELQARIRQRAYELWERDGRPEGRDHAHWHQAEREIGAPQRMG